ncbi:hypothetical protein ACIBKX_33320 [Streptomyces sp. NPDC050658]|uniref:hypothetical protein n=1 Tax=unclassified Streptomyces TaxID=2593676 RepID=UPI00343AECEE
MPWRLVATPFYSDIALAVYIKIKALGQRPEGCTAGTARLAEYLGMSKASVERGIALLRRPAPDGVVELPQNTRRSLPGGSGTTARRRVRAMSPTERFVWLPVAAAEDLTPRQLRAYAALVYAQAQRQPLSLGELAGMLRHSSGLRAGQTLTTAATGAVVDALEAAGWLTVHRRAGTQGRHQYTAHTLPSSLRPLRTEPTSDTPHKTPVDSSDATSAVGEGSGPQAGEGWLANKEDPRTARPDDGGAFVSPAVGEVPVVGPEPGRKMIGAPRFPARAAALALRADDHNHPSLAGPDGTMPNGVKATPRSSYDGPQLTLSPQIYAILEPVHWLLKQVNNTYVQRQIAREIGRQLREGMGPARLRHRLTARLAQVTPSEIRDIGRWILGVALPRWGCGHLDCETGMMWSTGRRCDACAQIAAEKSLSQQRAQRLEQGLCPDHGCRPGPVGSCGLCRLQQAAECASPAAAPAPSHVDDRPRGACGGCGARIFLLGQAVADGLCKVCRQEAGDQLPEGLDGDGAQRQGTTCVHDEGVPCGRPALPGRQLCVRHLALELSTATSGAHSVSGRSTSGEPNDVPNAWMTERGGVSVSLATV